MHSSMMRTARLLPVSPSMHCSRRDVPGPRVYLVPGGTWSRGVYLVGWCTWSQGVYLVLGGVLGPGECTWSWWVKLGPRGVCLVLVGIPGPGGVYLVPGGVPGPGSVPGLGGCTWSQGGACPGTPPCGQTVTCKNITLANFVCGR